MSQFPCNWCGSILTTKSNLVAHQKKAVYCLEMQTKKSKIEIEKDIKLFDCSNCDKSFSQKSNLNTHIKNCKSTYADKIKELQCALQISENRVKELTIRLEERDTQNKELKAQLAEKERNQNNITMTAITRPATNVKNNVKNLQINNLTPLLEGEMKSFLPQLTHEHVKQGAEGYAKYALEYPLKDKVAVADASRKKLAWKDADEKIIYDIQGIELAKKFFRTIKERNYKLVREVMQDITKRKDDAVERDDQVECDACDQMMYKLDDYRKYVREASLEEPSSDKNELRDAFINCLCKHVNFNSFESV